jgi:hypothetical protein
MSDVSRFNSSNGFFVVQSWPWLQRKINSCTVCGVRTLVLVQYSYVPGLIALAYMGRLCPTIVQRTISGLIRARSIFT